MATENNGIGETQKVVAAALLVAIGFILGYSSLSYVANGSMSTFYLLIGGFLVLAGGGVWMMVRGSIGKDGLLLFLILLSIMGLGVATYQTYEHVFLGSSVCDISASFSCSTVTQTRFGEFPQESGIPLAAYGMVWWTGMIALLKSQLWEKDWFSTPDFYTTGWGFLGVLTIIPLILIEVYILPQEIGQVAICPLCTIQHILILIVFGLSFLILEKPIKQYLEDIFFVEE